MCRQIIPPFISNLNKYICIDYYCVLCEAETTHFIDFVAYSKQHKVVSLNLTCRNCEEKANYLKKKAEPIKMRLDVSEWLEILADVNDFIRDN